MLWRGDYMVIIPKVEIEYKDVITLKAFSDVHLGNRNADIEAFSKYLNEYDENTYFICIGDFFDSIIVKDKRYSKGADAYMGEDMINQALKDAKELLSPIKDRFLGICSGNHENVFLLKTNFDITEHLCDILGIRYLGYDFLMNLKIDNKKLVIRGHHGWGGGSRTQGADLTKFSKDCQFWDADLFLYGHVHRLISDKVPRLSINDDKLEANPKYLVICGTFLKTFTDGTDATYSEVKGYPPVAIGAPIIKIKKDKKLHISVSIDDDI